MLLWSQRLVLYIPLFSMFFDLMYEIVPQGPRPGFFPDDKSQKKGAGLSHLCYFINCEPIIWHHGKFFALTVSSF